MIVPDVRYMDYDTYVFPGAKFNSSQWDVNREKKILHNTNESVAERQDYSSNNYIY